MAIKVPKEKLAEADKLANTFKREFYNRYGFNPIVIYELVPDTVYPIELDELEEICNSYIDLTEFPRGIKDRSRKHEVILYRQMYMHFAYKMKYRLVQIGRSSGFLHTSVIYGHQHIQDLIDNNDKEIITAYKTVLDEINERIRINAFLQPDFEGKLITEPILSA